ncbi:hypothetical protein [Polaromonas eurypsychrophila]|uniref:hypothetical protein n=1 Tax=Polaromonas eurypsychrophila TaxID=1614635 RepID=UPI00166D8F1C|nr:hypothetical protein [Polaromonas eurypsychrophila]
MQTPHEEPPQSSLDKGLTQTSRTTSQVAAIAPTRPWLWIVPWLLPIVAVVAYSLYVQDLNRRTAEADRLVDELCEKYAGITVYERVEAPAHYFRSHMPGELPITPHLPKDNDPYAYGDPIERVVLFGNPHRTGYPKISIREIPIIRRSDGAVLSKNTDIHLLGGDHFLETLVLDIISPSPMRSNRSCRKHAGGSNDQTAALYSNSPSYQSKLLPTTHAPRITYELRAKTR